MKVPSLRKTLKQIASMMVLISFVSMPMFFLTSSRTNSPLGEEWIMMFMLKMVHPLNHDLHIGCRDPK